MKNDSCGILNAWIKLPCDSMGNLAIHLVLVATVCIAAVFVAQWAVRKHDKSVS